MFKRISIIVLALLFLLVLPVSAQWTNYIRGNADLDTYEPFWWYPKGVGAIREWATDSVYKGVRSIKIAKSITTPNDVGWISGNQAQTYWNSMDAVLYQVGAIIKTNGVNTDPADMSERIGLYWEFLSGGSRIAEAFIPVDQTVASKDWDSLSTFVFLPSVPDSAYCYFKFGPNATGTAWADNFILGSDPWTAGFFGSPCETPAGWMNWASTSQVGVAQYTDEEAHSGSWSAKLMDLDTLSDEMVFYTIPSPCEPDQMYYISGWAKKVDIEPTDPHYLPVNWNTTRDDERIGFTVGFHGAPIETQWDWLGDNFFYIDQVDSMGDWEKYEVIATSPSDAAGVSMRARFTSFPQGTVYFDDFSVEKIELGPNILGNADLDTYEPFWWYPKGVGAIREWATDSVYKGVRSIKIAKSITTPNDVGWISGNQAQTYWNSMDAVLYQVGAIIKTNGVNTDPADMSERIGLYWEFLSGGSRIAEAFIPVDQTVASKDWDSLSTFVFLPSVPDSAYCYFKFGPNATGTAWADNFILGSDPWTAGFFGSPCETPAGWMNWASTSQVGVAQYTDEEAHSGSWSAKLMDLDTLSDEMVFYTIPSPCEPDQMYYISGWAKKVDIEPTDPHYLPVNWNTTRDDERIGFTVGFHGAPIETQWDWLGDNFFYIDQVDSMGDWEKYEVIATSPSDAAGVSMRARFTSFPQGTVYFDDFEVREVTILAGIEDEEGGDIITSYELMQNYPNPFVNETSISYQLPKDAHANLVIYDMLGRKVITLVNGLQLAGAHIVRWDGRSEDGSKVANGIYFYHLSTSDFQASQKMLILR